MRLLAFKLLLAVEVSRCSGSSIRENARGHRAFIHVQKRLQRTQELRRIRQSGHTCLGKHGKDMEGAYQGEGGEQHVLCKGTPITTSPWISTIQYIHQLSARSCPASSYLGNMKHHISSAFHVCNWHAMNNTCPRRGVIRAAGNTRPGPGEAKGGKTINVPIGRHGFAQCQPSCACGGKMGCRRRSGAESGLLIVDH